MQISQLFVYGLAIWRATSMLVSEDGPWFIFRRLRGATGIVHDENGAVLMVPDGFLAQLLSCVWCASVWVSATWVGLIVLQPKIMGVISAILALSTVAIMVEKWVRK